MNYLALSLVIFLGYLINKRLVEKADYTALSRIICGIVCLIIVLSIYLVQEYRKDNFNFWFGILPSFLAALGLPFAIVVMGRNIKPVFKNEFISWTVTTFIFLTIYEIVLWLDGRNFDIIDVLFTFIGALISGFIMSKLIPTILANEFRRKNR